MDLLADVARQAVRRPTALALTDHRGMRLDYATLHAHAHLVASALTRLGAGPGVRVAIALPRTADLFLVELGCLLAGACYTPLETAQPRDRLLLLLDRARAAVLVTEDADLAAAVPVPAATPAELRSRPGPPALPRSSRDDPAYCLFTSGSTGTPSGVLISRSALDVYSAAFARLVAAGPEERGAQLGSAGFDVTVDELWPFLRSGASVHIAADADRASPPALVRWLREHRITQTYVPPLLLEAVFRLAPRDLGEVRLIRTGGERVAGYPPDGFPCRVLNEYGPTETVAGAVFCDLSAWRDRDRLPPIGIPLPHVVADVRDLDGTPVSPGTPGELYLGGPTVGIGYADDPDRTAQRFVEVDGRRCFRTGDLVRELPGGELEYLRRIDDQVQLLGKRVELGEVEAAARTHPAVGRVVVAAPQDSTGRATRLVCFVRWRGGGADPEGLLGLLRGELPPHMVPSEVCAVDEFPTTPAGKVDRAALLRARDRPPSCAPAPPAILEVWKDVLDVDGLTPESDFFLNGGDSTHAVRVATLLGQRLGVRVSARDVFAHPTPAALAERLAEGAR